MPVVTVKKVVDTTETPINVNELKVVKQGIRGVDYAEFACRMGTVERGNGIKIFVGTTLIFKGEVSAMEEDEKRKKLVRVTVSSISIVLTRTFIQPKKYTNVAPENILQDLITTYTQFTFEKVPSGGSSGITLGEYFVHGYLNDIVAALTELMGAFFKVTPEGVFKLIFELQPSGRNFVIGQGGCKMKNWTKTDEQLYNDIIVEGEKMAFKTSESATGDGSKKDFDLKQPPVSIEVRVNGERKTPDVDYTVNKEQARVTFATAPPNGASIEFIYDYERTVVSRATDYESVSVNGKVTKKIILRSVQRAVDAFSYANGLLNYYGKIRWQGTLLLKGLHTDFEDLQTCTVMDNYRNITGTFDIAQVTWHYPRGLMEAVLTTHVPDVFEWQREVKRKILDLEARVGVHSALYMTYNPSETMKVSDSVSYTTKSSSESIWTINVDKLGYCEVG